jgi:hypothetical protein
VLLTHLLFLMPAELAHLAQDSIDSAGVGGSKEGSGQCRDFDIGGG